MFGEVDTTICNRFYLAFMYNFNNIHPKFNTKYICKKIDLLKDVSSKQRSSIE